MASCKSNVACDFWREEPEAKRLSHSRKGEGAQQLCYHESMTVWEQHPWSHHKGSTCRVRTGDQLYPVLCCHCHCQLGQDIPTVSIHHSRLKALRSPRCHVVLLSVTAYWPDPKSATSAEDSDLKVSHNSCYRLCKY